MAVAEAMFAEARQQLAEKAGGNARRPVARLAMSTEDDARAAVNRWLYGECRRLMGAEPPDDVEAVVDNLNTDEANLAGAGGMEL